MTSRAFPRDRFPPVRLCIAWMRLSVPSHTHGFAPDGVPRQESTTSGTFPSAFDDRRASSTTGSEISPRTCVQLIDNTLAKGGVEFLTLAGKGTHVEPSRERRLHGS